MNIEPEDLTDADLECIAKHAAALPGGYTPAVKDVEGWPIAYVIPADLKRSALFMILRANEQAFFQVRWTDGTSYGPAPFPNVEHAAGLVKGFVFPCGGDQFERDEALHFGGRRTP